MVLGLYYITKLRKGAKGEGLKFYGPEEAQIAYNEGRVTLHAPVSVTIPQLTNVPARPAAHTMRRKNSAIMTPAAIMMMELRRSSHRASCWAMSCVRAASKPAIFASRAV